MAGDPHKIFVDGVAPAKGDARAYLILLVDDATELRALDGSVMTHIYLKSLDRFFAKDTGDTTTADDGTTLIRDANGIAWSIVTLPGIDGVDGIDGATWYDGAGAPSGSPDFGVAGDFYLDTSSGDIYRKSGSPAAWGAAIMNIQGADGIDGTSLMTRVRVVDTADSDPQTAYQPGQSVDGVALAENDLVLRAFPTAGSPDGRIANGVYLVPAAGSPANTVLRHTSFDAYDDLPGVYFSVMEGSVNADTLWRCTSDKGGTLDTDPVVIAEFEADAANAVKTDVADQFSGLTEKITLHDDDLFLIEDSEASGAKKKVKRSSIAGGVGGLLPYRFRAHGNGALQTIPTAGVDTDIELTHTRWNDGNFFDTTNYRAVLPPGRWVLTGQLNYTNVNSVDGDKYYCFITQDRLIVDLANNRRPVNTDTVSSGRPMSEVDADGAAFFVLETQWSVGTGSNRQISLGGSESSFEGYLLEPYDGIGGLDANTRLLLHFNGKTGGTIVDSSANNHTVTASGDAEQFISAGRFIDDAQFFYNGWCFGGYLLLDGTGDFISVANHASLIPGTKSWQIDFQARLDAGSKFHTLCSKAAIATLASGGLLLQFDNHATDPKLSVYADSGSVTVTEAVGAPIDSRLHWCVSYDATTGTIRIFREGVQVGEQTGLSLDLDNTAPFTIGGSAEWDTVEGMVDEFRFQIYDTGPPEHVTDFDPPTMQYSEYGVGWWL